MTAFCIFIVVNAIKNEAESAKIEISTNRLDFGEVLANKKYSAEVKVYNRGSANLLISRIETCCGTKVQWDQKAIQPRNNATIKLQAFFDSTSQKEINIFSNDPERPKMTISLKAQLINPLKAPLFINVNQHRKSFHFDLDEKFKASLKDGRYFKVVSLKRAKSRHFVTLAVQENAPVGYLHDYLTILLEEPYGQVVKIPVCLDIAGDINVTPKLTRLFESPRVSTLVFMVQGTAEVNINFPLKYEELTVVRRPRVVTFTFTGVEHLVAGTYEIPVVQNGKEVSTLLLEVISRPKEVLPRLTSATLELLKSSRHLPKQTRCPYTGTPIKKHLYFDVSSYRLYTCCIPCLKRVRDTPDQAVKRILNFNETPYRDL